MTIGELRDQFLRQHSPPVPKKRNYKFSSSGQFAKQRNKKQIKLTSLESLTQLCIVKKCCSDNCITYVNNEQRIQE